MEKKNKKRWSEIALKNSEARRLQNARRRAFKMALPNNFSIEEFGVIITEEYSKEVFEIDHFIPLSWGHGGTYSENLCVIPKDMNARKSDTNPFEFIASLNEDEKAYFDKIVKRIAKQHNLTVDELKQYVDWCEQNKRSIEEILESGNIKSFELWNSLKQLSFSKNA